VIIKKMHQMGIRSEHAYLAAMGSIGLSVAAWAGSLSAEPGAGLDRADRWGIFVGEWAPTFFGLALSQFEQEEGTSRGRPAPARGREGSSARSSGSNEGVRVTAQLTPDARKPQRRRTGRCLLSCRK
jgi:hypothetical protein